MSDGNRKSVYLKIVDNIKRKVGLGLLAEGDRLPSCRDLAIEMGINPNTVQRAYSTLEEEGIIYTIPKKGVYVRGGRSDRTAAAEERVRELRDSGIGREELERIIEEVYGQK